MPEGWSLYLLELVSRILMQTRYLSTSYISVRVSTYRNDVKEWWYGLPFPTALAASNVQYVKNMECLSL